MDEDTKRKLEAIRHRVPRYLFRAWNNINDGTTRVSSGRIGLNTVHGIMSLASCFSHDHKSAYHMTKDKFVHMAKAHLYNQRHIETELSSWASSLTFAMNFMLRSNTRAQTDIHISIIDTKELWDIVQIFYVPALMQLSNDHWTCYPHEFLAHGFIGGQWHKAVPLRNFLEAGVRPQIEAMPWLASRPWSTPKPITMEIVRQAKEVGALYGDNFALPVCLAILCRFKRSDAFLNCDGPERELLLQGISGMQIDKQWANDPDGAICKGYYDVIQFCSLLNALGKCRLPNKQRGKRPCAVLEEENEREPCTPRTPSKKRVRFANPEVEKRTVEEIEREPRTPRTPHTKRLRSTKPDAAERAVEGEKTEDGTGWLDREMKKLTIDMEPACWDLDHKA